MARAAQPTGQRIEDAYVRLNRASALARRPGIVVLQEDLPILDEITGARATSHEVIATLERRGRLRPVRRGAYVLSDATGGVRVNLLDLIAALTPHPYLVSGGRALQFHELTDQHFHRANVLVTAQLRSWSWRGDEVRYARTERPFRGSATRTRKTHARIATPERAIADSLSHPAWGVTLSQVVEALDAMLNRDPTFSDRLAGEVAAAKNHALARRLGFLVSWLRSEDVARGFLPLRGESKAATPLLAGGPTSGTVDPIWRVRANADLRTLLQHRQVM